MVVHITVANWITKFRHHKTMRSGIIRRYPQWFSHARSFLQFLPTIFFPSDCNSV